MLLKVTGYLIQVYKSLSDMMFLSINEYLVDKLWLQHVIGLNKIFFLNSFFNSSFLNSIFSPMYDFINLNMQQKSHYFGYN